MECYRKTPIGESLVTSLQRMVKEKILSKTEALEFDQIFDDTIKEELIKPKRAINAEGTLEAYNCINDKWQLEGSDVLLRTGYRTLKIERIRILMNDSSQAKKKKKDI